MAFYVNRHMKKYHYLPTWTRAIRLCVEKCLWLVKDECRRNTVCKEKGLKQRTPAVMRTYLLRLRMAIPMHRANPPYNTKQPNKNIIHADNGILLSPYT